MRCGGRLNTPESRVQSSFLVCSFIHALISQVLSSTFDRSQGVSFLLKSYFCVPGASSWGPFGRGCREGNLYADHNFDFGF